MDINYNPHLIDSLNHPMAQTIRELLTREGRKKHNKIIIDDLENIHQAILGGVEIGSIISTEDVKDYFKEFNLNSNSNSNIKFIELSKRTGKKLFGGEKFVRQFAIAKTPEPISPDSLFNKINNIKQNSFSKSDLVALEDLSIAGNIGAIIRSALAFNAGGVVLLGADDLDIYDRRIIRSSRGYVFRLPVLAIGTQKWIDFCKFNQIKIISTQLNADLKIKDLKNISDRLCFVLGSEKSGCSSEIISQSDQSLTIQMNPIVESLNVSVACALILHARV